MYADSTFPQSNVEKWIWIWQVESFLHSKELIAIWTKIYIEFSEILTQPAFTCSMLIIKTLEQGVKYVQS